MHVRALLCEESFGHSWLDTIQQHSPFEKVTVRRPTRKLSLRERRRKAQAVSLHDRVWSFGEFTISPWLRRAGQARFMADIGWRLTLLAIVGLTLWLMGDAGSAHQREEQAWEKWKTDASVTDEESYMHFSAETPEVIAEWWETMEHQVLVPETLEGGFT